MVRHIVIWALNPDKKADAAAIAANLDKQFKALLGTVDGLRDIEAAHNYNGGSFDLILNCTFDSRESEKAYQTHPAHMAIKQVVHTLVCARECVDYEI